MNLTNTVAVYQDLYGGGQGSGCHGDNCGRKPGLSDRAQRALVSYKPVLPEQRRISALMEMAVAKAIGGEHMGNSYFFDVLKGSVAVEVKTLHDASTTQVNMKSKSRMKKEQYAKENHLRAYTVAIDLRSGKPQVYYKKDLGAYRLPSMERLSDIKELKRVLR